MSEILSLLQPHIAYFTDLRDAFYSDSLEAECSVFWERAFVQEEASLQSRKHAIGLLHLACIVKEEKLPEGWRERIPALFVSMSGFWNTLAETCFPFFQEIPEGDFLYEQVIESAWQAAVSRPYHSKALFALFPEVSKTRTQALLEPLLKSDNMEAEISSLYHDQQAWVSLLMFCEQLHMQAHFDKRRMAALLYECELRKSLGLANEHSFVHVLPTLLEDVSDEDYVSVFVTLETVPAYVYARSLTPALAELGWRSAEKENRLEVLHSDILYRQTSQSKRQIWFDAAVSQIREMETSSGRMTLSSFICTRAHLGPASVISLLDLDEDHIYKYMLAALMGVSDMYMDDKYLSVYQEAVISSFGTFSEAVQVRLARCLAFWALYQQDCTVIEQLLTQQWSAPVKLALEAAIERATPDWSELVARVPALVSGEETFDNAHRQREWQALCSGLEVGDFFHDRVPDACRFHPYEPALLVAVFLFLFPERQNNEVHWIFHNLMGIHKHHYQEAFAAILQKAPLERLRPVYEQVKEEAWVPTSVHMRVLGEMKGKYQQEALGPLSQNKEALDDVIGLLTSKKAGVRLAAVRLLQLYGEERAIGPLEKARKGDRSAKVKEAIDEAIEVLSGAKEELVLGVYRKGDVLDPVDAQEQLRSLLYEPGTMTSWVRVCDLLQRSRGTEAMQLLLDYLKGHGLDHWPEEERILPWSWEDGDLAWLGKPSPPRVFWTPVSTFFSGEYKPFLNAATAALEKKSHARKLPHHLVPNFVTWIEKAWAWCEANQVPLDWLEIRLDGGCYKGAGRPTTSQISLWHHFGIIFDREPAFTGYTGKEDIRWVKINLPKDHSYRRMYELRGGNRYLDLRDLAL